MSDNKTGNILLLFIFAIVGIVMIGAAFFKTIEFKQQFTSYVKGAADANSVELALDRLDPAIAFLEETNRTEGYSHIIIRTESANVGFWYDNLVSARNDIQKAVENEDLTQLEESNVLMKLRETLIDDSSDSPKITSPDHIVFYPNALGWYFLIILGIVSLILAGWQIVVITEGTASVIEIMIVVAIIVILLSVTFVS